jgi:hypothetical protein
VFALEYVKVCALDLAGALLVGALAFAEVLEAFALRAVVATRLLASVSAIAFRFGGIFNRCDSEMISRMVRKVGEKGEKWCVI